MRKKYREFLAENQKFVKDGSVINVHHNGEHVGHVYEPRKDIFGKTKGWDARSNHWSLKQFHKSKKAAGEWLASVHDTANAKKD